MGKNRDTGMKGEMTALYYLDKKGYEILEKNFRCSVGEIDIIARHSSVLCFVEVKTRRSLSMGLPCEAVNRQKMHKIRMAASYYMKINELEWMKCRIDVIEVLLLEGEKPAIRHLMDVGC